MQAMHDRTVLRLRVTQVMLRQFADTVAVATART
jgi:hypothetical protein